MERLVHDLVDLGAIEAGKLSIDVAAYRTGDLVDRALALATGQASARSVHLVSEGEGSLMVRCDRERILQVLANLVGNALQFSPAGASVRVRVEARGGRGVFSVSDAGPGIARDALPFVFDRYWQARHRGREGVGLGLSIALGLVAAHGGTLRVDSEPERGSTFTFDLPLA